MFRSLLHCASLCIAVFAGATGCQQELKGRPAPDQELYFPMGLAVSQRDPSTIYVMSTDWNQKYNTGWLSTINLRPVVVPNGTTSVADAEIGRLNVPALGGELSLSPGGDYLIGTFRQNNSLIVFNIEDDDTLSCGDPNATAGLNANDRRTDCDGTHLYEFTQEGVDKEFLADQFRSPFGVRFLPQAADAPQTVVVGFLQSYLSKCLVSFVDVDLSNATEILGNQRSIDLRENLSGVSVDAAGIVAAYPDISQGQYVAVGARFNQGGTTSASIFGINLDKYDFNAQITDDDVTDDLINDAYIERVDLRAEAGGFNVADLKFSKDGSRAFAVISYPQPAAGSSDSVVMLDTSLKTRQISLPNAQSDVVQRPEYVVLDTLAIRGTPQNVLYMERDGKPGLLVTATFNDNALHFVRVESTTLDSITRLDRQTGAGPVMLAETHFAPDFDPSVVHDYVLVTAFLNHVLAIFDVTDDNPGNWPQYELQSSLPEGNREH